MKRINSWGQEVDIRCLNCGNEFPTFVHSHIDDKHIRSNWCDKCGEEDQGPAWKDYTEKAILEANRTPLGWRMVERHRKDRAEAERNMKK